MTDALSKAERMLDEADCKESDKTSKLMRKALWKKHCEKNRGTVITSLQLSFTERVVPATQAFDWSLDNRCLFALTTGLV